MNSTAQRMAEPCHSMADSCHLMAEPCHAMARSCHMAASVKWAVSFRWQRG